MNLCSKLSSAAACLLLAFLNSAPASATTLTGAFTTDDQLFQYTLNLSQPSTAVAYTTSYATGGFVPCTLTLQYFNRCFHRR